MRGLPVILLTAWAWTAPSSSFALSEPGRGAVHEVRYVPFGAETYSPVTPDSIWNGHSRLRLTKQEYAWVVSLLRAAPPAGRVDRRAIRLGVTVSAGERAVVDKTGAILWVRSGRSGKLSAKDLAALANALNQALQRSRSGRATVLKGRGHAEVPRASSASPSTGTAATPR